MTARQIQKPLAELDELDEYVINWCNPGKDQYKAKEELKKLLQSDDAAKEEGLRKRITALEGQVRELKHEHSSTQGALEESRQLVAKLEGELQTARGAHLGDSARG